MPRPDVSISRHRYVVKLWSDYLHCGRLERLDRWLSAAMREYPQFGKRDRFAYADSLFAMARFSGPAIVLEKAFRACADILGIEDAWRRYWPCSEEDWRRALEKTSPDTLLIWRDILSMPQSGIIGADAEKRHAWWDFVKKGITAQPLNMILAGIPPFLRGALNERASRSGWDNESMTRFLSNLRTRPMLWLRLLHEDAGDEVFAQLRQKRLEVRRVADALAVSGDANIRALEAYRRGCVEIQDRASQEIVDMLGARPGEFIWDACTGGGGKAIAVASVIGPTGAVYASDIREYKLDELKRRAQRAGLENIRTFFADSTRSRQWDGEVEARGGFDRVLVDAPCSATGTWRRSPDARWHCNPEILLRQVDLQTRLISACAAAVRPGGVLAYATCSWLPEENEHVVERFVSDNLQWKVQSMGITGSPAEDADTMFAAVMRRKT